jgi:DNA polymerase-1
MPNLRRLFVPDPGMTLFEIDLKGADARVVAWDAGDFSLKAAFNSGIDIHLNNAREIWPNAPEAALPRLRQRAKTAVHAVNYGCKPRTLMEHISCSLGEAEAFTRRWFALHPAVSEWHRRIDAQVHSRASVTNAWGYTMRYFDRPDNLLPKALAWLGQSTTAIACNKLIVKLAREFPQGEILLQTHDSVTIQFPTAIVPDLLPQLQAACEITVPYPDPLRMPCEIKMSTTSWGEMHETHAFEELSRLD